MRCFLWSLVLCSLSSRAQGKGCDTRKHTDTHAHTQTVNKRTHTQSHGLSENGRQYIFSSSSFNFFFFFFTDAVKRARVCKEESVGVLLLVCERCLRAREDVCEVSVQECE